MFLIYYYIDNMHANEVSDFYDNLGKKSKKEIKETKKEADRLI
ncbi:hypothetical protein [Borreliella bavariensis]|nr:hypothetical protein [Borreliella bavariensis]